MNPAGIISTIASTGTAGYSGDGGPALLAQFDAPVHIAAYKGNLYVADKYNNCIRKISFDAPLSVPTITDKTAQSTLFPNPATNDITLTSSKPITKVIVMNMAGQVVAAYDYTTSQADNNVTISTRNMSPGMYALWMNDAYTGRFLKD